MNCPWCARKACPCVASPCYDLTNMAENPFIPDYDEPSPPPATLYKYVTPQRIDVLENGCIRFTPLLGTNDPFEVRQTFDRIAGPRFRAALLHEADVSDIDGLIVEEFEKLGLDRNAAAQLGQGAAQAFLGNDYAAVLRDQSKALVDLLITHLNTPANVDHMLIRLGGRLLALSLSEQFDSAVMWAHYAQNSTGFVIAFDSTSAFFREGKAGKSRAVHNIAYFDEKVDELLDDLRACLISKTADWSYEREWRVYVKVEEADRIEKRGGDDIHLLDFPASAISRVIAGTRATPETITHLQGILSAQYPGVSLTTIRPDRSSAKLIEVAIDPST
jgi:DUF2971 family protein